MGHYEVHAVSTRKDYESNNCVANAYTKLLAKSLYRSVYENMYSIDKPLTTNIFLMVHMYNAGNGAHFIYSKYHD
jgi:hypothetical protein